MKEALFRLRELQNKVPLGLLRPVFYATFVLSILLSIVFSPVFYLYGLLCARVWVEREKQGKDVIVVHAASTHSLEWMVRLSPLISKRSLVLDWSQRKHWDRWSLPVQLFEVFGPHGMPERFTEFSLPSVILFPQLQKPRTFNFGERAKDLDLRLERLRAELDLD